MFALLLLLVLI